MQRWERGRLAVQPAHAIDMELRSGDVERPGRPPTTSIPRSANRQTNVPVPQPTSSTLPTPSSSTITHSLTHIEDGVDARLGQFGPFA